MGGRGAPRGARGASRRGGPVSTDDFDLEEFTPYLINRLGSRLVEAFGRELTPHGFTIKDWRILATAWHYGELTQRSLAEHTTIDTSTLSRLVSGMVRRGLLISTRDRQDSRAVRIRLTPKGRAATAAIIPTARAYVRRSQLGLSHADVLKLHEVLRRMYQNLDVPGEAPRAEPAERGEQGPAPRPPRKR